jgi:hypothetical protein
MKRYLFSLAVASALLTGCERSTALTPEASYLRADVTGIHDIRYEGTGDFWTGGDPAIGVPLVVGIESRASSSARQPAVSL